MEEPKSNSQPQFQNQSRLSGQPEGPEPLKDAFESDDSYLITTFDENKKQERTGRLTPKHPQNISEKSHEQLPDRSFPSKNKSIGKKKQRQFRWRLLWVRVENSVKQSKYLWTRKWVRTRINVEPNVDVGKIEQKNNSAEPQY